MILLRKQAINIRTITQKTKKERLKRQGERLYSFET